ncbi:DUF171-domain-containing protein [Tilletiaria anomala UBC 951]|uniref:DUF171-domain-containing protein n=1 Tax=Tilletiaria anomala (strain ATCC 24038 / CBS 436.72 / UBC 951) TaxID=1037660 RepID=A0A066VNK1_TILAU|nr:DUF171-domain-containing protein [Tilletiaria anomala UBC 951]KDN40175.1 DUF171-domain-containing protein [Tilletiaria anomala UBC 951]
MADLTQLNPPKKKSKPNNHHHVQDAAHSSILDEANRKEAVSPFYSRVNPHKPSAFSLPITSSHGSRKHTLSIALPGSIILNSQSPELRARLVAHVARAAAIFNVDEIVIFKEGQRAKDTAVLESRGGYGRGRYSKGASITEEEGGTGDSYDEDAFMARILQYLETPQYLRKVLFPMHPDLRYAGLLPPLDLPHHLRREDQARYREGVIVSPNAKSSSKHNKDPMKSGMQEWLIDVGLWDNVRTEAPVSAGLAADMRVTVEMPKNESGKATLVSPRTPVEKQGMYWGYSVRLCDSLSQALSSSPWQSGTDASGDGGYDLVIGTSERGQPVSQLLALSGGGTGDAACASNAGIPPFHHAMLVFGGLSGLEVVIEHDKGIPLGADDAHELFDLWINVAENQGSRTIRTEEAVLIALSRLAPALETAGRKV